MKLPQSLHSGDVFLVKKVSGSAIFRVLGLLSGLTFTWWVASKYGNYSLGLMSLNLAAIYIAVVFLKLGIDTHIVAHVARLRSEGKTESIRSYFFKTFIIYSVSAALGICIVNLLVPLISGSSFGSKYQYLGFASFFLFPLMVLHLSSAFLRAFKKIMAFSFLLNGGVSFLSIIILLLTHSENVAAPLYAQLISISVLAGVSLVLVISIIKPLEPRHFDLSIKEILSQSIPMLIGTSVHPIWNWGVILITGLYIPVNLVGVLQLLLKCSNLIGLPNRAVSTIMAPLLSEEGGHSKEGVKSLIKKSSSMSFLFTLPLIILVIILSKSIMQFFGDEYIPYWFLLVIVGSAKFLNACFGSMGLVFMMIGRQKLQAKLSLIEICFFIFVVFLAVRFGGLNGAVISLFVSAVFRNLLMGSEIYSVFNVFPFGPLHLYYYLKK